MLPDRHYKPKAGEIVYHYCSPETFLAICSAKRLRFSDLFAMNDFMEVHWGYHVWERAASTLLDKVGKEFLDKIDAVIHRAGLQVLGLASCFSLNGDVLSQWRAYASDGAGYAIGFDASQVTNLAVHPLRVEYDPEKQLNEVKESILALYGFTLAEGESRAEEFSQECLRLGFDLCAFKNPAFIEENEVRLIHFVNFMPSNEALRLGDPGGVAFGQPAEPQSIGFHMSQSVPVAHVDLDFTASGSVHPISEVILGPRNEALPTGVSVCLETLGIPRVKVRRSSASYR